MTNLSNSVKKYFILYALLQYEVDLEYSLKSKKIFRPVESLSVTYTRVHQCMMSHKLSLTLSDLFFVNPLR